MNKKAQIFAVGLVLITLIALGYALYTFVMIKGNTETSLRPPIKLIDAYDAKTKLLFYVKESAKLAAQHAFDFVAEKKAASGNCTIDGNGYVGWSSNCKPNTTEIEENFLLEFKKSYESYMKDYPEKTSCNVTLEKNKINIKAANITLSITEKEYNASFTFEPSFSADVSDFGISLTDFESIYLAAQSCKSKDALNVKNCMTEKIKNWDTNVELRETSLLFDVITQKGFFFEEGFSAIKLKFKIES